MSAELKGSQVNITLSQPLTKIGRASSENHLIINDNEVSGHHAEIAQYGQGHTVVDRGSTNGTFVNGQRLALNVPRHLNDGDTLRFGHTIFTYVNRQFQHTPTRKAVPSYTPPPVSPPLSPAPFQQQVVISTPPTPAPPQKDSSDSGRPRWVIITGGLASLAAIFTLIFGIYTYFHPSPSSPTPTPTEVSSPTPSVLYSTDNAALQALCDDFTHEDYGLAYDQVTSKGYQANVTRQNFINGFSGYTCKNQTRWTPGGADEFIDVLLESQSRSPLCNRFGFVDNPDVGWKLDLVGLCM